MSATYTEAVDQIFGLFYEAWKASSGAIVGYIPEVRWLGVEEPENPDLAKYWARVALRNVGEPQTTLRDDSGKRRYTTTGLLTIEVFAPKSDSEAMTKARELGTIVRDSFRGATTSGHVWFRNPRVRDRIPEKHWFGVDVFVEYEYDEII